MESLHTLSTSLHDLGLTHHPSQLTSITPSLLGLFIDAFTRTTSNGDTDQSLQTLYDATFLRCLASTWPPEALLTSSLDDLIAALRSQVRILYYHYDVTSEQIEFTGSSFEGPSSARSGPISQTILDEDSDVALSPCFTFQVHGSDNRRCR
jgi:hypothetical protein